MRPRISATRFLRRRLVLLTVALVSTVSLAACSAPSAAPQPTSTPNSFPTGHVHGMSVDPGTDRVLLATHDGLYDVSTSPAQRIGPVIDLMGYTAGGNSTLYASGHPGPDTDLPNPVGLLRSTDSGKSWEPMSRQGQSDFHALTRTGTGESFVGYDGQLITSEDGLQWEAAETQIAPFDLSGATSSDVVLATTADGLYRSTDAGSTWSLVADSPLLLLTALAGDKAVGVTPEGDIHTSADAGVTWAKKGSIGAAPTAIDTHTDDGADQEIWVATETGVKVSGDGGTSFNDLVP
ncbi:exo-alpha-sialidase [Arthrobacter sp. EH-1B-1]|uniref:Exo-alpha-sialidase n=1 Tax=Arthrobacter vasquezii TaxID=2977629 RepID=A0ABT6CZM0_9MICC|nr:exo-alpha-sialidase [Arthrobacter vasquezii]MDF9279487.1 exo-alpha-sialidase [Arthrobacter vasquezii]